MRMWNVNPVNLCRQHLLGEHLEMHMFAGTIRKGISIQGYIEKGQVNPREIKNRHDMLAVEMIRRGYIHSSPLNFDCDVLPISEVNVLENELELQKRCFHCFTNFQNVK